MEHQLKLPGDWPVGVPRCAPLEPSRRGFSKRDGLRKLPMQLHWQGSAPESLTYASLRLARG